MSGFKQTGLVISEKDTPVIPTNPGDITVVARNGKLYKYDGVTETEVGAGDLSNYTLLSTTASISGDLQSQIDQIAQEGTSIASSGGSIIVTQNGINWNLEVASAPIQNHNSLQGLQGSGADYFHLNATQFASISGGVDLSAYTLLTTTASISGSLSSNINTRALDSNVVHTTGSETISGNKTFVNSISCMRGTNLHNEAFGVNTMVSIIDAQDNTAVGYGSSQLITTGKSNVSVGFNALNKNKVGDDNIAIGSQALINYLGGDNIAIGKSALYTTTGGSANTAVGNSALQNNTTGYYNTAMGRESLASNAGGSQNTGYGFQSLGGNWTASNNTGVGYRSLYGISTGGNNTAIGFESGYNSSVGAATNCIFVGYNAKPTVDSITNSICIGASTSISASNQVIIGNSNITSTKLRGVVTANDNNVNVIVDLSGAPTPTTTRVKGNIGYYGGYIYIWTSDSVVVRNAVETTW